MRCKNCGVEIKCKTSVCPLCHSHIDAENEKLAFPKANVKKLRLSLYKKIYLAIAFIVSIACITVNICSDINFMWCIMVVVGFIYMYYLISVTVLAQSGFHKRILGQTIILTLVFITIKLSIGGNHWVIITWLPAVYLGSEILMCIFIAKNRKESTKYVMTLLLLCIFGLLPLILAYTFNLSVKLPSIIATALSIALFCVSCIIWRKSLIHELKKVFHI